MKLSTTRAAFTLIELLVVISIIAILAGIAAPVYTAAILNARIAHGVADARSIGLGLQLYAQDHDGAFPKGKNNQGDAIVNSNDAFRDLIPTYLETESIFAVATSKAGPKADNKIETPEQILAAGENHWAYVMGLSSTSNANWPLIVDHTDGTGFYNNQESQLGGTWKGTKCIVVRSDTSASSVVQMGTGSRRFLPRYDDQTKNALITEDYMGDGVKLLEPAR